MASDDLLYLKPNVVVQPLVDRWYAWSHLIQPATLALNHAERHLPIMDSYVKAPQIHAAAAMDPELAGGPFIQLEVERVAEVAALAAEIREHRADLLEFGRQLRRLADLLSEKAKGYSLEALYAEIPSALRGLVEIAYDVQHRPLFRIIEPLLYASEYHQLSAQSLMLFEIDRDERPFVLSTPSLDEQRTLHLHLPFASPRVDLLSRLKWHAMTRASIRDALELDAEEFRQLDRLLTPVPPPRTGAFDGLGLRCRYYGHACVLVECGGVSVLTDPLIAYHFEGAVERFSFHDLPERIDYVLITHAHQDHTNLETLLQIRHRVGTVVVPRSGSGSLQDPSLRLILEQCGFKNVIEVEALDRIDLGGLAVRAIPFYGEHADLDVRAKMTYLVEGGGHKVYFASDTRNVEPFVYERVKKVVGEIDTVFIGMECDGAPLTWLYGPLLFAAPTPSTWRMEQSRCLSGSDAAMASELVRSLSPERAFVYSMGQEPWLKFLLSIEYEESSLPIRESNDFIASCRARGIHSERLYGRREWHLS
jgi:L-ascorbate metabolism protein UlaG (beta-lactamase superfamily)